MSERNLKAAKMQQPPPEEESSVPAAQRNNVMDTADRVSSAYYRLSESRKVKVEGHTKKPAYRNPYGVSERHYKIARHCMRNGITNIEGYVNAQFAYCVPTTPNDATIGRVADLSHYDNETAVSRWNTYRRRIVDDLRHKLNSSSLEFECRVAEAQTSFPHYTDKQLWKFVLMNKFVELSPLFRYCVAETEGMHEVAETYRLAALWQLLTDPISYKAAWGSAIPAPLLTEAGQIIFTEL